MLLDATTKTLEIDLGEAHTTNALPVTAVYVDLTTTTTVPASSDTASNGTTAVTIVAAPAASTQRKVNFISVYNADTVSHRVTIQLNNNETLRAIITITLGAGETLQYTDTQGWGLVTSAGVYALLSGATFTGPVLFDVPADIASASTVDLTGLGSGFVATVTGTTSTSALTMNDGQWGYLKSAAKWVLSHNATTLNVDNGYGGEMIAGDVILVYKKGSVVYAIPQVSIGVGQTLQDVKASRSTGTPYTNTDIRPLEWVVSGYSNATSGANYGQATVAGKTFIIGGGSGGSANSQLVTIQSTLTVAPGETFQLDIGGSWVIDRWMERRQ